MKDMSDLEKIQLRYNYVMSQTVNAQGDFVRTGGGAANQTRMFQEQIKELGVTFGQYILPYFTKAIMKLNDMLKAFNSLSPGAKKTILVIGAIAAAIGPLVTIIGSMITAIAGLNTALIWLASNPIVGTIALWTAAIWGVIQALRIVWELIKNISARLSGTKIGANLNLENDKNLEYLSQQKQQMGAKAFNKKYDKSIQKAVSNYEKNDNRTITSNSNNTNTTNNTYNTTNNYNSLLPMAQYGI